MDWLCVTVYCEAAAIDAVCACLTQAGAEEQEVVDDWNAIRNELESGKEYWDYVDKDEVMAQKQSVCVRVYVSGDEAGQEKLAKIESSISDLRAIDPSGLDFDPGSIRLESAIVNDEDWANTWKQFYKPIPIGERLLIVPEWEQSEEKGRIELSMEPGLVFGTGEHQSTQLCLAALEQCVKEGMEVLDLGCGSGILSIAALLLGASKALAVDIDPNAMAAARENAKRNAISDERYSIHIGDALKTTDLQKQILQKKYDLILANIVADVIIALLPLIKRCMKTDGLFICSGIISERLTDVEAALLEHGFCISKKTQKDDWICLEITY